MELFCSFSIIIKVIPLTISQIYPATYLENEVDKYQYATNLKIFTIGTTSSIIFEK